MGHKITNITKVEIKSLWGRFDLSWELQPDVNVLSGINGSGKSTILNCIATLISMGSMPNEMSKLIQSIKVVFDNQKYVLYENRIEAIESLGQKEITLNQLQMQLGELHELITIDVISTFDNVILHSSGRPDENVRTELDRDIFKLQKQYLDFQLNIGKKAFEIVTKNNGHTQNDILKIRKQQERFLEIIDNLFENTGKKIDRENNEITFLLGKDKISAYQLSSGEKQLLVILLTVLVQDNKPAIVFMDEPEISLHFDWQKKLIGYIRELNPNAQVILATHSPAVIMEGWRNKVKDVQDLIVLDKTKSKK